MGYQVEYLLALDPPGARIWLSQFEGFWAAPLEPDELPSGEFRLWDDLFILVEVGEQACRLRVPQIKYSWLIYQHAASSAHIQRVEQLFSTTLPNVRIVRIDEFLRLEWEQALGQTWECVDDPIGSLQSWLGATERDRAYFRFLPEKR